MKKGDTIMFNENGLTPKEQGFIDDYLFSEDNAIRGNGTKCILNHYNIEDNDLNTASVMASENLRKPRIIEYKDKKLAELQAEMDENWVFREMKSVYLESRAENNLTVAKGMLELVGKTRAMFKDVTKTDSSDLVEFIKSGLAKPSDNKDLAEDKDINA